MIKTDKLNFLTAGMPLITGKGGYPKAFEILKGEKIILNRSVLTEKDVEDFEHESRSEIFFNMPNVDDKVGESPALIELLLKLGFVKLDSNFKNSDGKMFNVFK